MPIPAEITRSPTGCTLENPSSTKFLSWCKQHQVLWPKCAPGMSATTGRCVLAQQDIAAGEVVVEVPDDMVLMAENCAIQDILADEGLTKPAEDALLEVQGLILAVMYEKALGSKSKWGAYLSFLPKSLSHMIVYWTDAELAELQGTAAHDKLLGQVQHPADAPTRVHQLFDELVTPLVMSHQRLATVLLGSKHAAKQLSASKERSEKLWQAYLWATAAVASYSFVLGDDHYQGMVAVWDLLNHITGAVNVRLHHDEHKGVLQMIATEDILKGQEVVNCYGQLSNAELLRGYGYVEQHNSIKHVQVPAHFCIKAAAAAVATSTTCEAPSKRQRQHHNTARAEKSTGEAADQGADQEPSHCLLEDSDISLDESSLSDKEDESSAGDDESSSDDSEPIWELEDDAVDLLAEQWKRQQQQHSTSTARQLMNNKQQQSTQQTHGKRSKPKQRRASQQPEQQQVMQVPCLTDAQEQMEDWEDRWRLCHSLRLLPKNGVFQLQAGDLEAPASALLAVLLLLVADSTDCIELAAAVAAAPAACTAALTAAAAAHGTEDIQNASESAAHSKRKKQRQQHQTLNKLKKPQQQQQQAAKCASQGCTHTPPLPALLCNVDDQAAQERLRSALHHLVALMHSRYTCTLQEDLALLQQQQQQQHDGSNGGLSPRLEAAVMARIAEKEVLRDMQQDMLSHPDAPKQLLQRAQLCIHEALHAKGSKATASTRRSGQHCADGHNCCDDPGQAHGCSLDCSPAQGQQHSHKEVGRSLKAGGAQADTTPTGGAAAAVREHVVPEKGAGGAGGAGKAPRGEAQHGGCTITQPGHDTAQAEGSGFVFNFDL